jgi:hypothetical protein
MLTANDILSKFESVPDYSDIEGRLEDAIGDLSGVSTKELLMSIDSKWKKKVASAKKVGVEDKNMSIWLADALYEDPKYIADLIGDWVHDDAGGDKVKAKAILKDLKKNSNHTPFQKACDILIKGWK